MVLALLRRGGIVLVGRFVFVGDAVEIEVVGDLAFLVALDFLALHRHAARRGWAEALADPLLHFVAGVACEGQEQKFGRAPVSPVAPLDEPTGLGHDHGGLAAAGCGDDQIAVVVEDDGVALFLGEWHGLDRVEQSA